MHKIAADETKKIEQERWVEWCDTFTNGNHARPITVEIIGDTAGAQEIADGVPLVAIDYDTPDKGNDFVISYGEDESPTRHIVSAPTVLWQGQDVNGRVVALDIECEGDVHTLITFD